MRRRFFALLILLFSITGTLTWAKSRVSVVNNLDWDLVFTVGDLTGGAGTDFPTDISSDAAQQLVTVKGSKGGDWTVHVERTSAGWHTGLILDVRRTSQGSPANTTVAQGATYRPITTIATALFIGTDDVDDVAVQYRINGGFASAGVPAGIYTTTVTYTITDN